MTLDDHCQRSGRAGTLRLCLSAFSAALEAAGASEQSLMPFGNGVCFARQQGGLMSQRMPACCALHMRSAQLDSHEIREESDGDKKSKFVVYSFRATQAPPPVGVPEYPLKPLLVCRWAFAVRPPAMATDTSQPRSRRPRLARAQTRCVFPRDRLRRERGTSRQWTERHCRSAAQLRKQTCGLIAAHARGDPVRCVEGVLSL